MVRGSVSMSSAEYGASLPRTGTLQVSSEIRVRPSLTREVLRDSFVVVKFPWQASRKHSSKSDDGMLVTFEAFHIFLMVVVSFASTVELCVKELDNVTRSSVTLKESMKAVALV